MENFWTIISRWPSFGQFIFFLLVLTGFCGLIRHLSYYVVVLVRGWPPEHVADLNITEEENGERE
jgi:hypothetical protein